MTHSIHNPTVAKSLVKITACINEQQRAMRAMNEAVTNAKFAGATWQQIGDMFGITRQAACDRFGKHRNDSY